MNEAIPTAESVLKVLPNRDDYTRNLLGLLQYQIDIYDIAGWNGKVCALQIPKTYAGQEHKHLMHALSSTALIWITRQGAAYNTLCILLGEETVMGESAAQLRTYVEANRQRFA